MLTKGNNIFARLQELRTIIDPDNILGWIDEIDFKKSIEEDNITNTSFAILHTASTALEKDNLKLANELWQLLLENNLTSRLEGYMLMFECIINSALADNNLALFNNVLKWISSNDLISIIKQKDYDDYISLYKFKKALLSNDVMYVKEILVGLFTKNTENNTKLSKDIVEIFISYLLENDSVTNAKLLDESYNYLFSNKLNNFIELVIQNYDILMNSAFKALQNKQIELSTKIGKHLFDNNFAKLNNNYYYLSDAINKSLLDNNLELAADIWQWLEDNNFIEKDNKKLKEYCYKGYNSFTSSISQALKHDNQIFMLNKFCNYLIKVAEINEPILGIKSILIHKNNLKVASCFLWVTEQNAPQFLSLLLKKLCNSQFERGNIPWEENYVEQAKKRVELIKALFGSSNVTADKIALDLPNYTKEQIDVIISVFNEHPCIECSDASIKYQPQEVSGFSQQISNEVLYYITGIESLGSDLEKLKAQIDASGNIDDIYDNKSDI